MKNTTYEDTLSEVEGLDEYGRRRQRVRRIPYDYVAKFPLSGAQGRKVVAVINISAEAWFICTTLGYGLEEPRLTVPDVLKRSSALIPPLAVAPLPALRFPDLDTPALALNISRLDSRLTLRSILSGLSGAQLTAAAKKVETALSIEQLYAAQTLNLRDSLSFKYAIIDKGSGRELQNEPIHNLAGLGKADGMRPFRELVVPYVFAPNSSILIELEEIITIADGIVHIDFQGYKEFR